VKEQKKGKETEKRIKKAGKRRNKERYSDMCRRVVDSLTALGT
jgi:hypothetical protein